MSIPLKHTPLKHTNGEQAVIGLLEKAVPQSEHALKAIRQHGFPTRRTEAWHYTDLRNLLKHYPDRAISDDGTAKSAFAACKNRLSCVELPIINGHYHPELAATLPQKILVANQSQKIKADNIAADDTIGLLNSALASDGLTIVVNENALIEDRLCLSHISSGECSSASRHNVKIGAGACAIFIERHFSASDHAALTNNICDLELGEGAVVTWVIDQQMSQKATLLGQLNVTLGRNADLTILSLNSGAKLVRQEIKVKVKGEGSDLKIRGVNLVGEGRAYRCYNTAGSSGARHHFK